MRRIGALLIVALAGCGSQPDTSDRGVPSGRLEAPDANFLEQLDRAPVASELIAVGEDTQAVILSLAHERYRPALLAAPNEGFSGAEVMASESVTVLLGSGFVSQANSLEPIGLLRVEDSTLSKLEPYGYTRVVGFDDSEIGVVHRRAYHRDLFANALQLGPGIIEQGELDISERDLARPKYHRSFLVLCADRWLVGVTLGPTNLRTLGQALLSHFEAASLSCPEVINFAGDRQALLMIRAADGTLYHGDPKTYKVSLLGFREIKPG